MVEHHRAGTTVERSLPDADWPGTGPTGPFKIALPVKGSFTKNRTTGDTSLDTAPNAKEPLVLTFGPQHPVRVLGASVRSVMQITLRFSGDAFFVSP